MCCVYVCHTYAHNIHTTQTDIYSNTLHIKNIESQRHLTSDAILSPLVPIILIYAHDIGRIAAEPQGAELTVPNESSQFIV